MLEKSFTEVYDKFNDDFDYEKYLNAVFRRFALRKEGLVLDCGCGTGVLMEKLTDLGYDTPRSASSRIF